jgi:hypothetical protein
LCVLLGPADAVAHLASLAQLEHLRLGGRVQYGASCAWTSLRALTRLTALDFSWCNHAKCALSGIIFAFVFLVVYVAATAVLFLCRGDDA